MLDISFSHKSESNAEQERWTKKIKHSAENNDRNG